MSTFSLFIGIQKLVLAGRLGEAISDTEKLYPGLLERNSNLLFMLKCRQFIEMLNGTDSEVRGAAIRSPRSRHSSGGTHHSNNNSPISSPHTEMLMNSPTHSPVRHHSSSLMRSKNNPTHANTSKTDMQSNNSVDGMNQTNASMNGNVSGVHINSHSVHSAVINDNSHTDDVDMLDSDMISDERAITNGTTAITNGSTSNGTTSNGTTNGTTLCHNGNSHHDAEDHEMGKDCNAIYLIYANYNYIL